MDTQFSIFLPFSKVDTEPDGSLTVWGRATQEVQDSEDETCDYASSAPLFRRRSQMMMDASEGQNLFPLRAMHLPIAAGKVVQMDYLDAEKAIDIAAKVVDPNEIKKVKERVYTGFSVAGKYARRWRDPATGGMKFTADPREISLVDVPSVPTAKLTMYKLEDPAFDEEVLGEAIEYLKKAAAGGDKREKELEKIGDAVGIERRPASPLAPFDHLPQLGDEYGDPANWAYPADINGYAKSIQLFNSKADEEIYSPRGRHILGRRIARLAGRFEKVRYDPEHKTIRKETPMTDSNLQSVRDALATMADSGNFSKDGIAALVGQLDVLASASQPVGSNTSGPTIETGSPVTGVPMVAVPGNPMQKAIPPEFKEKIKEKEDEGKDPSEKKEKEKEVSKMETLLEGLFEKVSALEAGLDAKIDAKLAPFQKAALFPA